MKKIFLTTITLLSIASTSVFGMYEADSTWIDLLTHGNQFRARMQQLGFTLGNDTIKVTFGFFNNGRGAYGSMLANTTDTNTDKPIEGLYDFTPTISMGLAYTSSLISVGVGYNATIGPRWDRFNGKTDSKKVEAVVHTPVLVLNALDNAFRMAIPIQVVSLNDKDVNGNKSSFTAVSLDAQFRYYMGLYALPQVKLYLRYGLYQDETKATKDAEKIKTKYTESFGFDFGLYFDSMVEKWLYNL